MRTDTKNIFIAMSGGVDSSAVAALLKEEGHRLAGGIMRLLPEELESDSTFESALADARRIADMLDIPFYVLDLREAFREQVIDVFLHEYGAGRTPNPCVMCNRFMKFGLLLGFAREKGYQRIATGHYAKASWSETYGKTVLRKGDDLRKDQSYFMYRLTTEQLEACEFPLGIYTKDRILEKATQLGFNVKQKGESQEICFIPDDDYRSFLRRYGREGMTEGAFVDLQGNPIGTHQGIGFYTVGQRKGLGLALGYPAYVCRIDPAANTIMVGPRESLEQTTFQVGDVVLSALDSLSEPLETTVKVRYRSRPLKAIVYPEKNGDCRVELQEPEAAITPGQSAVFYDEDIVLGGGFILATD